MPDEPKLDSLDLVNGVIADHQGDARAAVATLVADCQHLREQLALAESAMSRGLTRGWLPTYARD
ncbi:hypothetical protein FS764_11380 [Agrobacterium vitis]|nr:hypothetical protein [Agrobacterium vitis]